MGQIPVSLACLCCIFVSSNSSSWITSVLVETALDTACIHCWLPSTHSLQQQRSIEISVWCELAQQCNTNTTELYLGGRMAFRMSSFSCLFTFVEAGLSLGGGGEGRKWPAWKGLAFKERLCNVKRMGKCQNQQFSCWFTLVYWYVSLIDDV